MGHMVLKLVAVMPEAQMFFGAAEMILGAAADPVIIWMGSRTLPQSVATRDSGKNAGI